MRPYISRVVDSSKQAITSLQKTVSNLSWNTLTGKPDTFPPSTHTHSRSQILDFPSSLPANGGNADTVDGLHGYQLGTFASNGNSHGTGFPLMCQHNRDSDGMFKLYVEGQTTKVDFANNAHSVDGVHFHAGNPYPLVSNPTPFFYAFNSNDNYNCYVKNTSDITVGNANKLGGYTLEQIKRMCGGDYVGKQLLPIGRQAMPSGQTFTYSNSKGGVMRVTFPGGYLRYSVTVDNALLVSNREVSDFANTIAMDEGNGNSYRYELMIPFENTVKLTNHQPSGTHYIVPVVYVNK